MSVLPLLQVRPLLRYLSLGALVLGVIGAVGPMPIYNPAVVIYIVITSFSESEAAISLLTMLLPLTMITDVIWCIVHGYDRSGLNVYGIIITVFLLLVKIPLSFLLCCMYSGLGCKISSIFRIDSPSSAAEQTTYVPPTDKEAMNEPLHSSDNAQSGHQA